MFWILLHGFVRCWMMLIAIHLGISAGRDSVSLEGLWDFKLDPSNPITRSLVGAGRKTSGKIVVPGAWQAQGYGIETATMNHQYLGAATYSRTISIPSNFSASDKRIFIVVERVERSVQLYLNNHFICKHVGYLSPLECDISESVYGKPHALLKLVVNATRDLGVDCLFGEQDLVTDGTNLGGWGGIGGHIRLEARDARGWIVSPHVQQTVADSLNEATANVSITVGRSSSQPGERNLELHVKLFDPNGLTVGQTLAPCSGATCSTRSVELASPALWSPSSTALYTVEIKLLDKDTGLDLDSKEVRIGFKKLELTGYHWKLNGKWLFLHGYGDDSIYPESLAPPLNRSFYTERLKLAKSLGMNFVRHHSHILPNEYFEAACEQGVMISAEFPIAYGVPKDCDNPKATAYYVEQWTSIIQQIRNYPCVFDYTMDNEFIGLPFAKQLYSLAKQLDPTRLVNTADGLFSGATATYPNPVDFRSVQFPTGAIPLDQPDKFTIEGNPPVPVIVHEMGNYVTWPRLDWTISQFQHNIKPYWLQPVRDRMKSLGLLDENDVWSHCSIRLYIFCWKNNAEAARKVEKISGYEWWLIQDFWQGSNGIADTYWIPKLTSDELQIISTVNSPVVILVAQPGDGLPIPQNATRLLNAYSSNEVLSTSLHISNYGDDDLLNCTLSWQVLGIQSTGDSTVLCSASSMVSAIDQGPGTLLAAHVQCRLPDLGSIQSSPSFPLTLELKAQVHNKDGGLVAANQWLSRAFPLLEDGPSPLGHTVYTQAKHCNYIPINNMHCSIPAGGTKVPEGSVFVVDYIDSDILAFAADGSTVLFLDNGTGDKSAISLPTDKAEFKTAWWLGNEKDNNMGTVVYNTSAHVTKGMAPSGWADEGWHRLIQGGQNFILDSISQSADVLIRSIDLMGATTPVSSLEENPYKVLGRQKALMWQTRIVKEGGETGGVLLASGLNLLVNYVAAGMKPGPGAVPEAAWMLHRLLDYAFTGPTPSKSMTLRITRCPGCIPDTNVNICPVSQAVESFV